MKHHTDRVATKSQQEALRSLPRDGANMKDIGPSDPLNVYLDWCETHLSEWAKNALRRSAEDADAAQ